VRVKRTRLMWLGLGLLLMAPLLSAQERTPARTQAGDRPRVGLVLSGGGAKGAAHVGIIEVMEELDIPVDFIVGTSMGAIVGGLYASGVSPEQMRERLVEIDWADSFDDKPDRNRIPFRRKEDDLLPLFKVEFGLGKGGLKLPAGLVAGQKLNFLLRTMLLHASRPGSFDDLPIPFRAVAADLGTGEVVVLDHGDLPKAIRASMAFPLLFTPVEIDGRQLVDGGSLRNIPIDIALEMGADRLIVVDVSAKLKEIKDDPSAVAVSRRTVSLMSAQNREAQLALLRPQDLLIVPNLEGIGFDSFTESGEAIERGVQAAREHEEDLRSFSASGDDFDAFVRRQRAGTEVEPITLAFVEITGVETLSPKMVRKRVKTRPGDPLDLDKLARDLERVYKIGEFATVEFRLEERDGESGLVIEATEKAWGPWYMRPGISLATDLSGRGGFFLTGLFRRPQINRWGAEWKTVINVGSVNLFLTEFFQPVEPSGRFFVAPSFTKLKDSDDKLFLDDQEIAIKNEFAFGDFDLGVLFGNSGQIRVGYRRGEHEISPALTDGPPRRSDIGAGRLRATWDSLDEVNFPGTGNYTNFDAAVSRESIGADQDFDRVNLEFTQSGTIGRYSLTGTLRYGDSLGSELPFYATFPLGGFFNLSGLRDQELRGETLGFSRLMVYRQFGDVGNVLGGAVYLGVSLETGNVWTRQEDPSLSDLRTAGAVFAGVDSVLGPLYMGWGLADGGNSSFYLFLGRVFGQGLRRF